MELRILRSFLAVVREQSICGAARALHITQPSLSRQIMELEEGTVKTRLRRGRQMLKERLLFGKGEGKQKEKGKKTGDRGRNGKKDFTDKI